MQQFVNSGLKSDVKYWAKIRISNRFPLII